MSALPSGTVTFLFTDLEGSTRLWEERPGPMEVALVAHDAILRESVESTRGAVVDHGGDGMVAVFASASDAIAAGLQFALGIAASDEAEVVGLLPRVALHAGDGVLRADGRYVNQPLNRCSRLLAAGHGGQMLVSESVEALVRDGLPPGVELIGLGEHRLRDLARPMRVFQLVHPELRRDFPPLRSLDAFPGNLPLQVNSFIGREREIVRTVEALEASRVVTLTGVGGVGKTRLAYQVAAELLPEFGDGAWLVELAPVRDPAGVVDACVALFGVTARAGATLHEALVEFLRSKRMLLVVDNCEHLLEAVADLVESIERACPNVVVLATSREGLALDGERLLPVPSLGSPPGDVAIEAVGDSDAVRLFVERAVAVDPDFALSPQNAEAVAQVCRRLDGIPLAIELAAARTQSLSVTEIARHLDDRFKLLTRGARTALGRHQTLGAAIDWSFDLLDDAERRVLTRASVFAGGFTLEAAAAVCDPGAMSALDALDQVDGLVRRSLFIAEEDATSTRYRMLETIRQYGAERLEAGGDAAETSRAHLDWCAGFAREAGDGMRSRDDAAWLARMERELDNVRVALDFAVSIGDLESAKALIASAPIGALWDSRLGVSMAALARSVAAIVGEPDEPVRAAVLSLLALDAALRFAGDEAVALAERACIVARRNDDWLRTGPWLALLLSSLIAKRNDTVMAAAREALSRAMIDNDAFAIAEWHALLGVAHWMAGDVEEAQHLTEVGLALSEDIGADNLVMRNAFVRGVSLLVPGSDPAIAFGYLKRAVRLGERVGGNVFYGGAAWAMLLSDRGVDNSSAAVLAAELAANLPTPMFLIDADGMLVYFNDATATFLGKSFAEVGKINALEWGASMDLATMDGVPLRGRDSPPGIAFTQRRPVHQKIMATMYEGRRRTYEGTAHPLFGPAGEWQGVVCVFVEHTGAPDDRG